MTRVSTQGPLHTGWSQACTGAAPTGRRPLPRARAPSLPDYTPTGQLLQKLRISCAWPGRPPPQAPQGAQRTLTPARCLCRRQAGAQDQVPVRVQVPCDAQAAQLHAPPGAQGLACPRQVGCRERRCHAHTGSQQPAGGSALACQARHAHHSACLEAWQPLHLSNCTQDKRQLSDAASGPDPAGPIHAVLVHPTTAVMSDRTINQVPRRQAGRTPAVHHISVSRLRSNVCRSPARSSRRRSPSRSQSPAKAKRETTPLRSRRRSASRSRRCLVLPRAWC